MGNDSGHTTVSTPSGQAAIDAVQLMINKLKDEDVGMYNLDAGYVSTVLSAALPRIEEHMPLFEKLYDFDIAAVRALKLLLPALLHSNGLVLTHSPETSDFDKLAVEARALRETLLIVAELLVNRKAIAQSVVDEIRAGHGVVDLINDLTALRAIVEKHDDGSLVPKASLLRTSELIVELPRSYAQRQGKDPKLAPLLEQRKKIGALLIYGYAEAQAGVAYLRRKQKDADTITPSIYVPRSGPGAKKEAAEPAKPEPAPAPAPAPAKPAGPVNPLIPSDNPFDDKR